MKLFLKFYDVAVETFSSEAFQRAAEFKTLEVISADQAKAMIKNVTSDEAINANCSATVDLGDLKQLLSMDGLSGFKMLRANFTKEDGDKLANKPTVIVAVNMGKDTVFMKSNVVCPPPDGSFCLDGM